MSYAGKKFEFTNSDGRTTEWLIVSEPMADVFGVRLFVWCQPVRQVSRTRGRPLRRWQPFHLEDLPPLVVSTAQIPAVVPKNTTRETPGIRPGTDPR